MAKKNNTTDQQVDMLIEIVNKKKEEIKKAEHPVWITNCSFSYTPETSARINLHTIQDAYELARMLGFIHQKRAEFLTGIEALKLPKAEFKWMGYTFDDWKNDLLQRADKIQIAHKKKELETLEARLNLLISPEKRKQMELADIMRTLEKDK